MQQKKDKVIRFDHIRSIQEISIDIELKILNDLDDKMHNLSELAIARPYLVKICNMNAGSQAPKEECNVCSHTFYLYQRTRSINWS